MKRLRKTIVVTRSRPTRSYTCLEDRSVFVGSGIAGLWIKTHVCVVLVACPYCKAAKGAPCTRASGHPGTGTHVLRRKAAAKLVRKPGWAVVAVDKIKVRQ